MLVYALIDPVTNMLRYVGQTTVTLDERLYGHLYNAKTLRGKSHCRKWLTSLSERGLVPEAEVLEFGFMTQEELDDAEEFWIGYFRMIGAPLTNHQDGGHGGRPDAATRLKMSLSAKGKKKSESHCKNISLIGRPSSQRGRKNNEENLERMRLAQLGKKQSPETIAKRVEKLTGMKKHGSTVRCKNDEREFISQRAAAEFYGLLELNVSRICDGKILKPRHGLLFERL